MQKLSYEKRNAKKAGGKNTIAYNLSGITTLGIIRHERTNIDTQVFEMPVPRSDPSKTIVLDLFGTIKTVSLEGSFVNGTDGKTIKQFVDQFLIILNGSQTTRIYTSDTMTSTIKVILKDFNYTYEEGDINRISWNMTLEECAEVT